ncbi:hypothetical protein FH972_023649 [Carpinus fangiana]|uniref:Uncharacterized protein n=1 Tax=Carpinus fangiana TaxID=176857 RepID=A0A5N6KY23_9ROSI|nr:hypothetical protein FH972_023649 [Carpinus fangiana]
MGRKLGRCAQVSLARRVSSSTAAQLLWVGGVWLVEEALHCRCNTAACPEAVHAAMADETDEGTGLYCGRHGHAHCWWRAGGLRLTMPRWKQRALRFLLARALCRPWWWEGERCPRLTHAGGLAAGDAGSSRAHLNFVHLPRTAVACVRPGLRCNGACLATLGRPIPLDLPSSISVVFCLGARAADPASSYRIHLAHPKTRVQ